MTGVESTGAVVGVVAVLMSIVAAVYKLGPDRTKIIVESAKVSVEMSDTLRDDLREDVAALRAELAERRREDDLYRSDVESRLAELSAQVRAERAEKEHVKGENRRLLQRVTRAEKRVTELEAEVGRLRDRSE